MTTLATQPRPLTPREIVRRQREFYEAAEPIRKRMMAVMIVQPFKLTKTAEGVTRETLWRPGAKEAFDMGQEAIDHIAEQIMGRRP